MSTEIDKSSLHQIKYKDFITGSLGGETISLGALPHRGPPIPLRTA